jgi:salicylate hydroxylase
MTTGQEGHINLPRISIVGGGIGGLTAALALQHFEYPVAIFEQARELREIGAGVVISPNAMHALNFLGVGERVAQKAGPAEALVTRHFHTGAVLKVRVHDYAERFGASYHQVHRSIFTPHWLTRCVAMIQAACSWAIASKP